MAAKSCVFLMYHELELAGRKLCQSEPGYVRYILSLEAFRTQMAWLKESGWRGLNVSGALQYASEQQRGEDDLLEHPPAESSVCITFDDGCETDLIAAAPVLREFGFYSTFYVTAGFVGMPGYLNPAQLRELDAQGFEIGCHSMTHPYLPDLPEPELKREIADAKKRIEEITGRAVEHFSCPGGRYNRRVIEMAQRAGFKTVANSDFHANSATTNHYELGRIAILRDLTVNEFGAICQARGLWRKRFQHQARRGVQRLLGNRAYDQLRGALLGEHR